MSPAAALDSDVFRAYASIVLGLLLLVAVLLATLRWGLGKNVDHAWAAFRGWLVMVPAILLAVLLGRATAIVFFALIAVFAFKEYARATGLYRDWFMSGAVYLGIAAIAAVSLATDPFTGAPGWYGLFMALPVFVIAGLLFIPILRNRAEGQLQTLALAILGFIYIGWMFGHLIFLCNAQNAYGYLLYLLFAVELNDVAAFTCGKLFGRHRLRSNISPNKTWEGAIGAVVVSLALPWLLHFSFPQFGALQCVLTGLIVGVGGQLGDLSISVIKRDVGVKDMGAAIRGHGGFLDRIDSLIYVAPLFFHMTRYFYDLN